MAKMVVERQFHKDDDENKERRILTVGKEHVHNYYCNDAGERDSYVNQVCLFSSVY